jgi:hypothetical protein
MNETFNLKRFWLLVRRQWAENYKVILLIWGLISLSLMTISIFFENRDFQIALFYLVFWMGGCAVVFVSFCQWSDKGRSSLYFLLPASLAEKFLCGIFFSLILFLSMYVVNYFIIRFFVTYLVILLVPNNMAPFSSFMIAAVKSITNTPFSFYIFSLSTLLFLQSVLMIIFIQFRKRQLWIFLLLTLSVLVVFNIILGRLIHYFGHIPRLTIVSPGLIFPHFNLGFGFFGRSSFSFEYFYFIKPIRNLNNFIWLIIYALLYLTAAYKLKEREL